MDWTFTDEHMEAARKIVAKLDAARSSGGSVPEIHIIAQGIADFEGGD
jgi:hypothetical protein